MLLHVNLVFILVPAKIQSLTGNLTVDETNPINLRCEASGYPSPAVTWTKGGRPVQSAGSGVILIGNSTRGDSGTYVCMTDNAVGQAVQMKTFVTVYCK